MPPQAQPVPSQDISADFDADWQKAQERYQTGLSSGYDEATADTLYLAPIRQKWKIIQSAPALFTDKSKMSKINSDFENAQESAVKNLNRSEPVDQTVISRIAPLTQKWTIAAEFPSTPRTPQTPAQVAAWYAKNPAMQSEEQETLKQIDQGIPETEAILAHPTLLQHAPYASRWNPRFTSALNREQRAEAKAGAEPNMAKLARTRKFFAGELATNPDLPDEIRQQYESQIGNIDESLSPFPKGVTFNPPANQPADQSAPEQPAATATPGQPADNSSEPIPYKKGMKLVKDQPYTIGTDKFTYVWDGNKFVSQ